MRDIYLCAPTTCRTPSYFYLHSNRIRAHPSSTHIPLDSFCLREVGLRQGRTAVVVVVVHHAQVLSGGVVVVGLPGDVRVRVRVGVGVGVPVVVGLLVTIGAGKRHRRSL